MDEPKRLGLLATRLQIEARVRWLETQRVIEERQRKEFVEFAKTAPLFLAYPVYAADMSFKSYSKKGRRR